MPHIKISGVEREKLKSVSKEIIALVAKGSNSTTEHMKVFYSPLEYIAGKEDKIFPAIDIYWMPRSQEICDRVAKSLTDLFQRENFDFVQITFLELSSNLYYENGKHY